MVLGSNIENFSIRILPVNAEKRSKCAKLIPAGIELPPLIQIFTAFFRIFITFFHAKPTDIHCPIRQSRHGKIDPGRNLRFHIFPNRSDISAPCDSTVTLHPCKTRTGKNKYPLTFAITPLPVVNSLSIHQCISIEIHCGGSVIRRIHQRFPIVDTCIGKNIGFGSIEPPCIYV